MKLDKYLQYTQAPKEVKTPFILKDEVGEAGLKEKIIGLEHTLQRLTDQEQELKELQERYNSLHREHEQNRANLSNTQEKLQALEMKSGHTTQKVDELSKIENLYNYIEPKYNKVTEELIEYKSLCQSQSILLDDLKIKEKDISDSYFSLSKEYNMLLSNHNNLETNYDALNNQQEELLDANNMLAAQQDYLEKDREETLDKNSILEQRIEYVRNQADEIKDENATIKNTKQADENQIKQKQDEVKVLVINNDKLNNKIKNLHSKLTDTQEENMDLHFLKNEYEEFLRRPRYASQEAIAKMEGFKIPLAMSAIKRNSLGNSKATMLRFKKEEANVN